MRTRMILVGLLTWAITLVSVASSDTNAVDYAQLVEQQYQEPTTLTMAADVLIARPLLVGATAVGFVLFIVSSPFSLLGGNFAEAGDMLVGVPGRAAFSRCLGCAGIGYS